MAETLSPEGRGNATTSANSTQVSIIRQVLANNGLEPYSEGISPEGYSYLQFEDEHSGFATIWIHSDGSVCVREGLKEVDEDKKLVKYICKCLSDSEIENYYWKDCKARKK